ncbi:MAG: spermidine synthase [Pseudomonadota bacterium]|nr:spermidine synthase [Pseudomonadota bacterium]
MRQEARDTASAPCEFIDAAEIPGGGALHLVRWGDDFSIQYDDEELMGSQVRHSEQALATLVCNRLADTVGCARLADRGADLLIGGLGMGFTLGAALAALGPDGSVVVAELVPKIVTWANGPLAHIFGNSLADPRVMVEVVDVHDVIARATASYDGILLDVDNGPDGLIQLANDRLYCNWGLRSAHAALRPGGILAIWSSYSDADFFERLERAGFDVDEITIRADSYGVEANHTIWMAAKAE